MTLSNREFAERAQEFLPDELMEELSQMHHQVTLDTTCEGHMLFSYILDYGVNVLASQIGMDEVKSKIWPQIQQMVKDVNEQHLTSLGALRAKYPEECAAAEAEALKQSDDKDRKLALLREMLGQVEG